MLPWWYITINNRRGGGTKNSRDSTSSDAVKRVERERHIATHHEDRRKRMRLVREKNRDDNPMQVINIHYSVAVVTTMCGRSLRHNICVLVMMLLGWMLLTSTMWRLMYYLTTPDHYCNNHLMSLLKLLHPVHKVPASVVYWANYQWSAKPRLFSWRFMLHTSKVDYKSYL